MGTSQRITAYFRLLFSSFFNWWWAAVTGVASILSFLAIPKEGITISPLSFGLGILAVSMLLFLAATTAFQGWLLFDQQLTALRYLGLYSSDQENYEGGLIFIIESPIPVANGSILELRRRLQGAEGAECLVAMLEVVEISLNGRLQAQSIWAAPVHLLELRSSKIQLTDLIISPTITRRALGRVLETRK